MSAYGQYGQSPDLDALLDAPAPETDSAPLPETDTEANGFAAQMIDGARYVLDAPPGVPALWGKGSQVLWAEGEALMIAGPQGVGKTTLLGQLARSMIGLGGDVLGLPVAEVGRLCYLAMDRPRQIQRSLARSFTAADRHTLEHKLVVWQGPPPHDLAKNPGLLLQLAEAAQADTVILDSLKDAALGLSEDEVGAGYNRARQTFLRSGRNLAESHHVVKRSGGGQGGPPTSINDVYGSTWLTSGAGSVILLTGEPGDPIIGFRHLKQPADEVGPYRLLHNQTSGQITVEHAADLLALVRATGVDGLTAKVAASAISEKPNPSRSDVEKARRKLEQLAVDGVLVKIEGAPRAGGGKPATAWVLAENSNHGQSRGDAKPQLEQSREQSRNLWTVDQSRSYESNHG